VEVSVLPKRRALFLIESPSFHDLEFLSKVYLPGEATSSSLLSPTQIMHGDE
jgi:hypothetical protein